MDNPAACVGSEILRYHPNDSVHYERKSRSKDYSSTFVLKDTILKEFMGSASMTHANLFNSPPASLERKLSALPRPSVLRIKSLLRAAFPKLMKSANRKIFRR